MSSKSRHNHEPRKPSQKVDHVDGGHADLPSLEDFQEIVHVPEGRSKFQFLFLIGLMIFLLIVFIIPSAFQNALTGGDDREELLAVSWVTETGEHSMSNSDFINEKRREDTFRRTLNPFVRSTPSSSEVASMLVLDQLSSDAGVWVPDADLSKALAGIAEQLGGIEQYKQYLSARFPQGAPGFENSVRRGMRITRYLETIGRLGAKASASEIESTWKAQHTEYAFDYIEAPASAFEDEAMAEVVDDATLEAWFAARPEWERNALKTQKAWQLASAYVNIGAAAPAALLERYPLPADFDAAAEGDHFYTAYSYLAYRLEQPRLDDEGNELRYVPKEEVAPELAAAAEAQTALRAWREDIKARNDAGETVDLAAEAAELGVTFVAGKAQRERAELVEDQEFGGGVLTGQLGSAKAGDILNGVIVTAKVLELVEVLEVREPELPPFAKIRDSVAASWSKAHAAELARAYLEEKVAGATSLDATSFAALAIDDDKLTLGLRDWMDVSATDAPAAFEPASMFIRSQAQVLGLYELPEDGLSTPAIASSKDRAFLVRSLGSRERDFSTATPAEVDVVKNSLQQASLAAFRGAYMSEEGELPKYLVEAFQLALPQEEFNEKQQAEERATREAEQALQGESLPEEQG